MAHEPAVRKLQEKLSARQADTQNQKVGKVILETFPPSNNKEQTK